jgi:hypothetical protein
MVLVPFKRLQGYPNLYNSQVLLSLQNIVFIVIIEVQISAGHFTNSKPCITGLSVCLD